MLPLIRCGSSILAIEGENAVLQPSQLAESSPPLQRGDLSSLWQRVEALSATPGVYMFKDAAGERLSYAVHLFNLGDNRIYIWCRAGNAIIA